MIMFKVKFYRWCFYLSFKVNFHIKINFNFQGQYIRLCVKFKVWGYGVRLMLMFNGDVECYCLSLSFKFKNCGYVLEKWLM
jgi:hypothetical protein